MKKSKEEFLKLVDRHDPSVMKDVKWRIANREMLRESRSIALKILDRLDEWKWSKADLADKLGVKAQQVSKFVSGNTNFEIQTLLKLQSILDIPLTASYYEQRFEEFHKLLGIIEAIDLEFGESQSNYENERDDVSGKKDAKIVEMSYSNYTQEMSSEKQA